MISPLDPEWYPNIVWLSDAPGEWLQYMKNNCRPTWVLFGDFYQQKTETAIEALAPIMEARGYHPASNPTGDVQFVYANAKSLGGLGQLPEFGAPSAASWASVRSTPTHVLYIAGMEYKRAWGVVTEAAAGDLCDEIVTVMNLFRANDGNFDSCSSTFEWEGTESQAYGGDPELVVDT